MNALSLPETSAHRARALEPHLSRKLTARERRVLKARLNQLRYDRRQELRRARHAVGYIAARGNELATERDPSWSRYYVDEILHSIPYVTRHRAEARRLLREIAALTAALGAP